MAQVAALDEFIPNRDRRGFYPLRDFLRAPPVSVAARYIEMLTAPGDLVLDPFGAMPTVARAAHGHGRRAIVVESNPLWAWLARAMASLPPASEIDAALARLGDARKDDAPLRAHINQLYTTTCAACAQPTPADYFVHAREGGLLARHYTCAHCGATRDDPATEDDLQRLASFNPRGMHYHFAFERVLPADNLHAERIRKMLDLYTPRNLYALVTLTSKIDSLFHATREQSILRLLLLHLLERGASLYPTPDAAPQLRPLKQFVEFNLWRQVEIAARALGNEPTALDLAESPGEVIAAPTPLAFVGRGSAPRLAREMPRDSVALVVTTPPTRRVALWAMAYFWGAWTLGRDRVQTLTPFLDPKKDATWEWRWYSDGLNESVSALAAITRADARLVFVFAESWHPVIETLLLAGAQAGLGLEAFLFQPRLGDLPRREFEDIRGEYRVVFAHPAQTDREQRTPNAEARATPLDARLRTAAFAAASEILARRGEALAFSWVHHAAFAHLARAGLLAESLATIKTAPGRFIHNAAMAGLSEGYAHDFDHYASPTQFVWLRRSRELAPPLIDRVEAFVLDALARPIGREELQDAAYRTFPGDLTPEAGVVELCAAAYAEEREGTWHLRAFDAAERAHALDILARLGKRLGYTVPEVGQYVVPNLDLAWFADGDLAHAFVWRDRARFTDLVTTQIAPARGYLVIPETLVALLREKMRRLPHLADAFHEAGWDCVRVPFVERWLNADKIEPNALAWVVGLDPPAAQARAQLELL